MNFPTKHGCRRKIIIRSSSDVKIPVCNTCHINKNIRVWSRKVYDQAHSFCISGLSTSLDQETFFSCDALRINMWNLEVTSDVFSIMDRPLNTLDDRTHLITGLDCSTQNAAIFAYCTNRGSIRMHDLRTGTNFDSPVICFDSLHPDEPNLLTLLVSAISDMKMANSSDRYIFTRDYLTLKVWDTFMPTSPVEIYPAQAKLRSHLSLLYESELLCDDFKLSVSSDDRFLLTGSYNQAVKVFDRRASASVSSDYSLQMLPEDINAFVDPFRSTDTSSLFTSPISESADLPWPRKITDDSKANEFDSDDIMTDFGLSSSFNRKWLQACWKPGSYAAAVSHSDAIHLFEGLPG